MATASQNEYKEITFTVEDGGIGLITLNRPEVLNAFTYTMISEWLDVFDRCKRDRSIRALVVTGAGRGFCSGVDSSGKPGTHLHPADEPGQPELPPVARRNHLKESVQRIPRSLVDLEIPYIAAVNGLALGGGMEMCNNADFRIASDKATFGEIFINIGSMPGDGGCYYLSRIVGVPKALELILTGDIIDAQEAYRIGYVQKVVPHDQLMSYTMEFARKLASKSPVAVAMIKRLVYRGQHLDANTALEMTEMMSFITSLTEDRAELRKARQEKRAPAFKGY
ncbi:MAG: enoyl-CoA hydratase/isomerase family protein [Deltaproteobacteria bacterium]|nr:enoyl-CoA hydratase/isomerase family protein [Deltaproteobacteria bacterium]